MILEMTNSKKLVHVSAKDFRWLRKFTWGLTDDGYPITSVKSKCIGIGPLILGRKKGMIVDHKDGNPLNNYRRNLRMVSASQSCMNRRGWAKKTIPFKGVHLDRKRNQYRALLMANGVRFQSPRFNTAREAALAYDKMAREHHGWFARTNFL